MEVLISIYKTLISLLFPISFVYTFVAYKDVRNMWPFNERNSDSAKKIDAQVNAISMVINEKIPLLKTFLERAFLIVSFSALALSSYLLR